MGLDRTEFNKLSKRLIDEVGRCELCGSRRNLETHHIIPKCAKFPGMDIDLDDEDNLIVVCGSCHAKLTPKRMLTKYGIRKLPEMCGMNAVYKRIKELDYRIDTVELLDLVEEIFT